MVSIFPFFNPLKVVFSIFFIESARQVGQVGQIGLWRDARAPGKIALRLVRQKKKRCLN
jgi:hypothetical protein